MTSGRGADGTTVERDHLRPPGVQGEVHGGRLWGTWTCSCRAGGSAWSRGGAARALDAHVAREHRDQP